MNPKRPSPASRRNPDLFDDWLRKERGLSEETDQSYCRGRRPLLLWLAGKGTPLTPSDCRHRRCHCGGTQARSLEQTNDTRLRAATEGVLPLRRGRRAVSVGAGRQAPWRLGSWRTKPCRRASGREDVLRLLASVQGVSPGRQARPRDPHAVRRLRATGRGSRRAAARRSDWENEIIRVRCPNRAEPMSGHSHRLSAMPFCATSRKPVRAVTDEASSSRRKRPSDRSAEKLSAKSSTIVLQASASSAVVAARMPCGMPPPSICWTRACP